MHNEINFQPSFSYYFIEFSKFDVMYVCVAVGYVVGKLIPLRK